MSSTIDAEPFPERARWALLNATRSHLAEYGYRHLSVDRVAAIAGIGKQTMYERGPSKNVLVAECVRLGLVEIPRFTVANTSDAQADIGGWLQEFAAASRNERAAELVRASMSAAAEDSDAADVYRQGFAKTEAELVERLHVAKAAGQLQATSNPTALASILFGAVMARIIARRQLEPEFLDELMQAIFHRS